MILERQWRRSMMQSAPGRRHRKTTRVLESFTSSGWQSCSSSDEGGDGGPICPGAVPGGTRARRSRERPALRLEKADDVHREDGGTQRNKQTGATKHTNRF
jgi:hypothetical protein